MRVQQFRSRSFTGCVASIPKVGVWLEHLEQAPRWKVGEGALLVLLIGLRRLQRHGRHHRTKDSLLVRGGLRCSSQVKLEGDILQRNTAISVDFDVSWRRENFRDPDMILK